MVSFNAIIAASLAITSLTMAAPITSTESNLAERSEDVYATDVTHTGRGTYFYAGGIGSCGTTWSDSDHIAAMSATLMGPASNDNPVCGRRAKVTSSSDPSKTVTVVFVDKCPGDECTSGSLDLSPSAFEQLAPLSNGVVPITWQFL